MLKLLSIAASIILLSSTTFSQSVSINNNGAQPAAGAMLDIQHAAKGILIPRVALTGYNDATTLPDRPTSLLIFNTATTSGTDAVSPGYYFWNNNKWNRLMADDQSSLSGWLLGGNKGTSSGTHFIGTRDSVNLVFKVAGNEAGYIGLEGSTSFGYESSKNNHSGQNIAIGRRALYSNTSVFNIAIGDSALFYNTSSTNTAVGFKTMLRNTSGHDNTAMGSFALYQNSTGSNNTAIGVNALADNIDGAYNTALGASSLQRHRYGQGNVAIGYGAATWDTSGTQNIAIGFFTLFSSRNDNGLVAVGNEAMYANNGGLRNTALGYTAMRNNVTGTGNTALGYQAAYNTLSGKITAIGSEALFQNSTGFENTAVGYQAMYANTSGKFNTALGSNASTGLTTGSWNVAIGGASMSSTTTGSGNTAVGYGALLDNQTGLANTALGYYALVNDPNLSYATAIGAEATVGCSNCLVLGNGQVKVGIGYSNPGYPLNFSNTLGDKISLYGNTGPHYGFGVQNFLLQIFADGASSDVALGYGSSAAFTENFRVKGNGNVTLGTANAAATLTFGQSLSKKIILFRGGTGGEAAIGVFPNELRLQGDYTGAAVTFGNDNAGTFQQNFRVEGNGNGVLRGNMFANGVLLTSDSRSKKDITLIEGGLDKITQLNAYHYYWKENNNDESLQTGVIAQEVQQLFPELVKTTENGTLTVNYTGLIPYLIQSIKEQQKKIEQLEKTQERLLKLEKEMEKLKKRLN